MTLEKVALGIAVMLMGWLVLDAIDRHLRRKHMAGEERRERCCVEGCTKAPWLIYLGDGFCHRHWQEKCAAEEAARQDAERAATLARQQELFKGR